MNRVLKDELDKLDEAVSQEPGPSCRERYAENYDHKRPHNSRK
jgi:hypothetical protein